MLEPDAHSPHTHKLLLQILNRVGVSSARPPRIIRQRSEVKVSEGPVAAPIYGPRLTDNKLLTGGRPEGCVSVSAEAVASHGHAGGAAWGRPRPGFLRPARAPQYYRHQH